jgi:hypothetical protein
MCERVLAVVFERQGGFFGRVLALAVAESDVWCRTRCGCRRYTSITSRRAVWNCSPWHATRHRCWTPIRQVTGRSGVGSLELNRLPSVSPQATAT